MAGNVCAFDVCGELRLRAGASKRLKLGFGVPLLVDVDAVRLDRVCGDDEVAATRRVAQLPPNAERMQGTRRDARARRRFGLRR